VKRQGQVAQLVEQRTENPRVGSSILPLAIAEHMHTTFWRSRRRTSAVAAPTLAALILAAPVSLQAQADVLTGLLGSATDFNFFWTQAGAPKGELKPERNSGAAGVGFELTFEIPGGFSRERTAPKTRSSNPAGKSCEARFARGELRQGAACADTTVKSVKRTRPGGGVAVYEEELDIQEFDWKEPVVSFEFAAGFSQTGTYVSRTSINDIRVSLREAPSVSLYANYEPGLSLPGGSLATYFGARSGLISLVGGAAFTESDNRKFTGETFQVGPVAGLVTEFRGINFFVEGAYMWRDFKGVGWEGDAPLGALPRRIDLTGPSLAIGIQFQVRKSGE
jgi:hypothetical protein